MSAPTMSPPDYQHVQDRVLLFARGVRGLKLEAFCNAANYAESVGPFLEQSVHLKAGEPLEEVKRLGYALLVFQREVEAVARQSASRGRPWAEE